MLKKIVAWIKEVKIRGSEVATMANITTVI
jgi:hypothetical protein